MTRPIRFLVLALVAAPLVTYWIYKLARGLGFLDPPLNPEHEQRRTIVVALFAFVLFLAIFLFGHANAWPRAWAIFGVVNGLALIVFGGTGVVAARRLWKLRHPVEIAPAPAATPDEPGSESAADKPLA